MIDTLRFSLPVPPKNLLHELAQYARLRTLSDGKTNTLLSYQIQSVLDTPSYNRGVQFFYNSSIDRLFVEFSLAKHYYNHNIYLLYPNDTDQALDKLFYFLRSRLPSIPELDTWRLDRLDLCYNWRLESQKHAEQLMHQLQCLKYPRQKTYRYDSSVMCVGSSYSSKFYLKHPEYYKHDYPIISKTDPDQAHRLLSIAEGVLRFEITLRSKYLKAHGLVVPASRLSALPFYDILNSVLSKLLPVGTCSTNQLDTYQILLAHYRASKALRLYQFWALYYSSASDRYILNSSLSRSQVWRNKRDLTSASIGIPSDLPLDLSIPSPYSTN